VEIIKVPLNRVSNIRPLPSPLDETTSHSTKLQKAVAKSLVTPVGEGLREGVLGWNHVIYNGYFRNSLFPK